MLNHRLPRKRIFCFFSSIPARALESENPVPGAQRIYKSSPTALVFLSRALPRRPLSRDFPTPWPCSTPVRSSTMTSMLYVGNLGMQTTEDQLAQSFASFGCAGAEVISTGAYSDDRYCGYEQDFSEAWKARRGYRSLEQYRHSRGFGFVYFSDEGQMEQAFAAATPPNVLLLRTGEETEPRVLRVKKYTPQSLRTSDGLVEHSEVAAESMMQQRCPKPSRRGRGLRSGAPRTAPRRRTKKEDAADDEQSLSSLSSQASSSHLSATAASWTPSRSSMTQTRAARASKPNHTAARRGSHVATARGACLWPSRAGGRPRPRDLLPKAAASHASEEGLTHPCQEGTARNRKSRGEQGTRDAITRKEGK